MPSARRPGSSIGCLKCARPIWPGTSSASSGATMMARTYVGLPLGHVTRGNLTRQEDDLGPLSGNRWVQSQRSRYDAYGNQTGRMDPLGALAAQRPARPRDTGRPSPSTPTFHAYPVDGGHPTGQRPRADCWRRLRSRAGRHHPRRRFQRPGSCRSDTIPWRGRPPSSSPATAWPCRRSASPTPWAAP